MIGFEVYNQNAVQFTTKYPALLVDRTNSYGYKNYKLTFTTNPALPPDPPAGSFSSIYIDLITLHHGLGYIPAFQSVTIAFGISTTWNGGISMWNEDALLSYNTSVGAGSTDVKNQLVFRAGTQDLYIKLFRQSETIGATVYRPPSLAGVELDINTQIFAMGLNDPPSIVL